MSDIRQEFIRPCGGQYYLMLEEYDGDMPEIRDDLRGFGVQIESNLIYVQCLDDDLTDSVLLNVNIEDFPRPDYMRDDEWQDDWEAIAEGIWCPKGPTVIASAEDAEIGALLDEAGHYEFLFLARRRDPARTEPGESAEEHQLFIWPQKAL